jgi:hypothetical protein
MGEPCGVPDVVSVTTPPSNTPARSQQRSSFNICRVNDPAFDLRHEGVVVDVVKARFDGGVEHPQPPLADRLADRPEGVVCGTLRTEPETDR